jgi:hypothetical protein
VSPVDTKRPTGGGSGSSDGPAPAPTAAATAAAARARLEVVYGRHAPEKLGAVDALLEK